MLLEKQEKQEVEAEEQIAETQILIPMQDEIRTIGLCGDVDEEKTAELIGGLVTLAESVEPQSPMPINFFLSTAGGSAYEMFAIYDTMKMVQKTCEIHTVGLGKVMSAGVLLLAGGTKGQRQIGRNCRVMIHGVIAGPGHAQIDNLENEMDEIRWIQEQYIKALAKETNLKRSDLKKLINKKVNNYFTAKEAIKLGIADKIL
jgi:ATP-dependent Clp protease protease subunit